MSAVGRAVLWALLALAAAIPDGRVRVAPGCLDAPLAPGCLP